MKIGIHKDLYGKFCPFLQVYEKILDYNDIKHVRLDSSDPDFWEQVATLDLFIFRYYHYDDHFQQARAVLPIVEKSMGIKCFPDQNTSWHFDDKIRQFFLLKVHKFPVINSWVFWDREKAQQWIKTAKYPLVFKLTRGAGSTNVLLVNDYVTARGLIKRMFHHGIHSQRINLPNALQKKFFNPVKQTRHLLGNLIRKMNSEDSNKFWQIQKNYAYFQEFLPGNEFDTRVTVIRDRAFGFVRYVRPDDFRASGSGTLNYSTELVDERCIQIALDVSKKMQFQSMAYDFLYDSKGEPQIAEISYTYVDRAIYNCPGYWDNQLQFHEGHYWPQYLQLVDALEMPGLKQPEIEI